MTIPRCINGYLNHKITMVNVIYGIRAALACKMLILLTDKRTNIIFT